MVTRSVSTPAAVQAGGTTSTSTATAPAISKARAVLAKAAVEALTGPEKTTLQLLEGVIEKGLNTFIDVGNALLRIRDERLYRESHGTFELYCRDRWQFSKTQANRFIAASSVAKNLAPIGVIPTSESQVRLLASFKPDKQVKVFERAAKKSGGAEKVTAAAIHDAARAMHLIHAPQASAATRDGSNLVKRADVIAAMQEWAEEKWEKVSGLSVADFMKEFKKVLADA